MIIVNIDSTCVRCGGIWQYDYGQILRIQNLKLPPAVEIHFSLSERGGQAVTRVGTTRDNVTDVVIPDSMLENADTAADYKIYAFIYLADQEIGQTEYKISMSVRSRPRPEQFEKQEDGELFRKAISEVNKSADSALQSKKEAEAWAHGHEECPDRHEDNAKYYANQAKDEAQKIPDKVVDGKNVIDQYVEEQKSSLKTDFEDILAEGRKSATSAEESATKAKTAKDESVAVAKEAKQSAEDANTSAQASKESASTASSASDTANSAKEIAVSAANSADSNALAASKSAQEAKQSAEQADTAAKSANESKQAIEQLKTAIDTTAEQIATDRTAVETDKKEVQKAKSDVEDLKSAVEQKSSEALVDLENTEVVIKKKINDLKDVVIEKGNEAISGIETARDNAINDVNNAKDSAVNTIAQEKDSAVNDVNEAKDNAVAEINKNENVQQIKQNKEDIAEAKTDIEELKDKKITKFYANSIGESYLQDSDNSKIQDMILYGRSEQKQYTGKNLANGVNNGLRINSGATTCGISDTDSGLYIDVSKLSYVTVSTRNVQKRYRVGNINTLPTKEVPNVDCYNGIQMDGLNRSYTLDTTGYKYLAVNATNLEDIQIEIGTEATAYEPYTGGIPSPNPDYPQEIRSVVNPVVKIHGKNLLPFPYADKSKVTNGVTFDVMNDGRVHVFGTATGNAYINLSEGIEWSDESFSSSTSNGIKLIGNLFYNKDNKILSHCVNTGNTVDYVLSPMVMLEKETNINYEQYKEQVVNLPYTLNAIPVSTDGNITIDGQQYIADYVDDEKGKYIQRIQEVKLDANFTWRFIKGGKSGNYIFQMSLIQNGYTESVGIIKNIKNTTSSHFCYTNLTFDDTTLKGSKIYTYDLEMSISFDSSSSIDSLDKFKKLLNENEIIVQYVLAKPIEHDLSEEDINKLKSLETYYPVTNVSVTSDELDGYATFNYPVSMKNGWDYVKQQLNDNRDYIYDMDAKTQDIDTQSAEAYVNSEYAVALTELEVM